MQRNTVAANWQVGTYFDTYVPGFNADPYIKYMIRAHAHPNPPWTTPGQAGLQMVAAATLGAVTDCRQGGGPDGPCGPTCDPVCVMRTSLDVARTYGTAFIEIWAQDDVNRRSGNRQFRCYFYRRDLYRKAGAVGRQIAQKLRKRVISAPFSFEIRLHKLPHAREMYESDAPFARRASVRSRT